MDTTEYERGWADGFDDGLAEGHAQGLGLMTDEISTVTRVYLSARFARREELRRYAEHLAEAGIEVTSQWLTADAGDDPARALQDFEDLRKSTVLVTFSEDIWDHVERDEYGDLVVSQRLTASLSRGGRHVELGLAYAMGLTCIVVGKLENVFHSLPGVLQFDHWHECLEFLRS